MKILATTILLVLSIGLSITHGQKVVNLRMGIGTPEQAFVGTVYKINRFGAGTSFGTAFKKDFTISADGWYYFGSNSDAGHRKMFFRSGLFYRRQFTLYEMTKSISLYARVGRSFFLLENAGIELDLGVITTLRFRTYDGYFPGNSETYARPSKLAPTGSFSFFYMF